VKEVATELGNVFASKHIDFEKFYNEVKSKLGTEEEPFEGELPW
jgi:hypothetical protein